MLLCLSGNGCCRVDRIACAGVENRGKNRKSTKRCGLDRLNLIYAKRAVARPPNGLIRYPRLFYTRRAPYAWAILPVFSAAPRARGTAGAQAEMDDDDMSRKRKHDMSRKRFRRVGIVLQGCMVDSFVPGVPASRVLRKGDMILVSLHSLLFADS